MGYSPYSELIDKMQNEIEILRGISANNQDDIFHKQQEQIIELNNKLYQSDKQLNSLKLENKELKKKNDSLHMSFMVLENVKLKDENANLKNENTFLQNSINTINDELQTLKETIESKPKKKKTSSRKRTWGLSSNKHKNLRNEVLKRDNYTCQICGCTNKPLHIHHIKERRYGGTNDKYNLISLCPSCHAEQHKNESVYNIMKKSI